MIFIQIHKYGDLTMSLSDIFKAKKVADQQKELSTPEVKIEGLSDLIEAHLDMVSGGAYGRGVHSKTSIA
ncbi:MAG: hypothetical protein ACI9SP_000866 [Arenicella sp.]|jgi:hypothetical protein